MRNVTHLHLSPYLASRRRKKRRGRSRKQGVFFVHVMLAYRGQ
jgi:hypothetical protein